MNRVIITHNAPDLDAVSSSWIIKRFLPGWDLSEVKTIPAGMRVSRIDENGFPVYGFLPEKAKAPTDVIEKMNGVEVIHVDTGMGALDHHQTGDDSICAAKLAYNEVLKHSDQNGLLPGKNKRLALERLVEYAVDDDHFQEVFYADPTNDVYDLSIVGLLAGQKLLYPKDDATVIAFGMDLLDSALHVLENKIQAEQEIKEKGIDFQTKWGKAIAIETANDAVLKIAQTMGYVISVRKDPVSGAVRIKSRPGRRTGKTFADTVYSHEEVDLTPIYEKLKKMDSDATWFLHASKRMLLNGSSKNPNMRGSKLTLSEVVEVLQNN